MANKYVDLAGNPHENLKGKFKRFRHEDVWRHPFGITVMVTYKGLVIPVMPHQNNIRYLESIYQKAINDLWRE